MSRWRLGRSWTSAEIEAELADLDGLDRNFDNDPEEMTVAHGWKEYYSEAIVGREEPGPPRAGDAFERGREAVASYAFSDPRIVIAHFDPLVDLVGRRMLLEIRALRAFRYLAGVIVAAVRDESSDDASVFGFRYDTLQGHIECGIEWFLLTKDHATGKIRFRVQAAWQSGDFPNWWSRAGFQLLAPYYQRAWHAEAHARLADLIRLPVAIAPGTDERGITHTRPEVLFKRIKATHESQ